MALMEPDASSEPVECRLDPAHVAALYVEHADQLRAFLLGVLRERELVAEALQRAFVKAIEYGHAARAESFKSWLFQVAYREALALRRSQATDSRAMQQVAGNVQAAGDVGRSESPDVVIARRETIAAVRAALESLPPDQRRVVRMRMYDEMKFTEIAQQLGVPLGTVLTRMQLAMKKLRVALASE
jgi:RNA polymerase sigma-70 factor, ECF subfamily